MSKVKETGVGILFFAFLVGMASLTIALTDFSLFEDTCSVTAYFDRGAGIRTGDNVQIMGVIRGKVMEVEFLSAPRRLPGSSVRLWVRTELQVEVPLASFLKEDYELRIRNSNLLGGKVVEIELGESQNILPVEAVEEGLIGLAATDPFEEIGDFIAENRPDIDRIIANVDSFSGDIRTITEDIRTGEGVAHDLIYNRTLAETLRASVSGARDAAEALGRLTADVQNGQGLLGQVVYNEDWPRTVSAIMNDASAVMADVHAGKGVLGQAVYNDEWAARVSSLLANTDNIVADARAGRGALGLILSDERLRHDIAAAAGNFRRVSEVASDVAVNLAEGRGLLGVLLTDEQAAAKVKALLDLALLSLEDAREAAPMSSLGSFLLGSF